MAKAQVMHGARALVQINKQPVGVFNEVSWVYGLIDAEVDILGAYAPVDIIYVGASAVTADATGWRVSITARMVVASVPKLRELLTYEGVEIQIMDRQAKPGDPPICTIRDVKPMGYSGGVAAKQLSDRAHPVQGHCASTTSPAPTRKTHRCLVDHGRVTLPPEEGSLPPRNMKRASPVLVTR
jgi:hypothetical protein